MLLHSHQNECCRSLSCHQRPLSDRRRDIRAGSSARCEGLPYRPSDNIQRSSSLDYDHQDLLGSQIKHFLQRTDRTSTERWKSRSRSSDINGKDILKKTKDHRATFLPNSSYSDASISSSRENSISEEIEESIYSQSENGVGEQKISRGAKSRFLSEENGVGTLDNKDDVDCVSRKMYESLKQQLHVTTVHLNQKHEMEVDRLMSLRKQMEKKLYDAYESLDEQKQIICQWKKKYDKLTHNYTELQLQFEDQMSQISLIEKKREKEDYDFQYIHEELNNEKKLNDKLIKEKEHINQEKSKLDEALTDTRLELQHKMSQIKFLTEELSNNKGNVPESELEDWKKANSKLSTKCVELEEELQNSLTQMELMEDARFKTEHSILKLKKEHRQEISQRKEEVEEVRYSMEKKIKTLHCQLEQEHYEKISLMKEKLKLEKQMEDFQNSVCQSESTKMSLLEKMKNKLVKTKALLKDERNKDQSKQNSKILLRKLKNQLDGMELEKLTAVKTKQKYEMEYADLAHNMAELERSKSETERKLENVLREIKCQRNMLENKDEELAKVMTRFKATTEMIVTNQTLIQELTDKVARSEVEKTSFVEKTASLQSKLDNMESLATSSTKLQAESFKAKIKELESKNELDQTIIARKELQITQITAQLEKLQYENDNYQKMLGDTAREAKYTTRQLKNHQDEIKKLLLRESELLMRNKDLAQKIEATDTEKDMLLAELKSTNERIIDLKRAMDASSSYFSDSSTESVEDPTISRVSINDFKYRSETPDSILSDLSDVEAENKRIFSE